MLSLWTRGQAVTSPRESNLLVSGGWAARRLVYSTTDTWASQLAIVTTETPERESSPSALRSVHTGFLAAQGKEQGLGGK